MKSQRERTDRFLFWYLAVSVFLLLPWGTVDHLVRFGGPDLPRMDKPSPLLVLQWIAPLAPLLLVVGVVLFVRSHRRPNLRRKGVWLMFSASVLSCLVGLGSNGADGVAGIAAMSVPYLALNAACALALAKPLEPRPEDADPAVIAARELRLLVVGRIVVFLFACALLLPMMFISMVRGVAILLSFPIWIMGDGRGRNDGRAALTGHMDTGWIAMLGAIVIGAGLLFALVSIASRSRRGVSIAAAIAHGGLAGVWLSLLLDGSVGNGLVPIVASAPFVLVTIYAGKGIYKELDREAA